MRGFMWTRFKAYVKRVLVAFDMFWNVVLLGHPDETISTRAGRARDHGKLWGRILADVLDKLQPQHVELARVHDEQRAEVVDQMDKDDSDIDT